MFQICLGWRSGWTGALIGWGFNGLLPVSRDSEIGVGILRVLFGHGEYGSKGGQCRLICVFHLAHFVTLYIMHLSAR